MWRDAKEAKDLGMEVLLKISSKMKEETRPEIIGSDEDCRDVSKVITVCAGERNSTSSNARSPSLNPKESEATDEEDQLETTKAEMGEVKEENERLKMILARITKDYEALQMHLFNVINQDQNKNEESDLVSLSLGSSSRFQRQEEKTAVAPEVEEDKLMKGDLTLGLNSRFDRRDALSVEAPSNSSSENATEEPNRPLKIPRFEDDELSHRAPVKNARVSVRARCDTPTMNDGCQWRKYGQKIAKGNPCPRAYYRCTVAPACPVRKQVQRCADDMSILITTYEGTHNHPLPASATAIASTTAAAASMLLSGASASRPTAGVSGMAPVTAGTGNFGLSSLSSHRQFYLPNPSISSYSSYPTITLDLTSPPLTFPPALQFKKLSTPVAAPTSLNFSSESPANSYLSYGQLGFFNHGRQHQETQLHQPFLQRTVSSDHHVSTQNPLGSSIAAATKAITSDPSFQSALAVAISSMVGQGRQDSTEAQGQVNLKVQPLESSLNNTVSGSSYLGRSNSSNLIPQQAKIPLFPLTSEAVATSKCGSASPIDGGDKMN